MDMKKFHKIRVIFSPYLNQLEIGIPFINQDFNPLQLESKYGKIKYKKFFALF